MEQLRAAEFRARAAAQQQLNTQQPQQVNASSGGQQQLPSQPAGTVQPLTPAAAPAQPPTNTTA